MEVPITVMSPKRVLELMLDIKEPNGDRSAHDHHGSLHEKEGADAISQTSRETTPAIAALVPIVLAQGCQPERIMPIGRR